MISLLKKTAPKRVNTNPFRVLPAQQLVFAIEDMLRCCKVWRESR